MMNQSKIKYLKSRVDDVYSQKYNKISKQYIKKPLSVKEKAEALKAGEFSIKEEINTRNGYYIDDFIIFHNAVEPDFNERDAKLAELLRKKTELLDEIVLGDEENALQLLRGFAGE